MPEKIKFPSPEEKKEQKIRETLEREGGIFYSEETDPETKEKKSFVNILGVEVETFVSKEDIEAIKKEIVLSEVDQRMLRTIAECYKLRQPLMFEGDPGVGKTFLMKKFVQLIHGRQAPILELVGTPRTSELEILGHWAPKGIKEKEAEEYRELLRNFMERGEGKGLTEKFNQGLAELNQKFLSNKISQEQFQEEFGQLTTQYINRSRTAIAELAQLTKLVKPESQWEFKEGALLQTYAGREGKGYILIVDEFNLIPSNYQQIFLQIGGEKGALSDSISFWGNTGKTNYHRGKDTWICFACNFPEKTPGRGEVVAPMTDRLVWRTITNEETEKKKEVILKVAGGRLTRRQKELTALIPEIVVIPAEKKLAWHKVLDEQLGEQIADVIWLLDQEFVKNYQEVGDSITIKGNKRRRIQHFEFSGRNPLRLYSYLDYFQVRDLETGRIDFAKTLSNAFERYYLSRLVDSSERTKMQVLFNEIMSGTTGKIEFEGQTRTRKEIFDILIERASPPETPASQEEKQKKEDEEKKKESIQTLINIKDLLS